MAAGAQAGADDPLRPNTLRQIPRTRVAPLRLMPAPEAVHRALDLLRPPAGLLSEERKVGRGLAWLGGRCRIKFGHGGCSQLEVTVATAGPLATGRPLLPIYSGGQV